MSSVLPPGAAPPPPVGRAPASLSTLPLELRAHICNLASSQDLTYRGRWEDQRAELHTAIQITRKHRENAWRGRSLAALSETCRTFNVLAAKHIFHTLHAEQLGTTYFLLRILPRHATHVRQANLLGCADKDTLVRAVAILPALPHLSRLVLQAAAAAQLFDNTFIFGFLDSHVAMEYPTQHLNLAPFRTVAARLDHLELWGGLELTAITALLRLAPILTSVDLEMSSYQTLGDGEEEDMSPLVECLASMAGLRHFRFAFASPESSLAGPWLRRTWAGNLTSIHISMFSLTEENFAFIDKFAPTLRHLNLEVNSGPDRDLPALPFFHAEYPVLESFTIRNCIVRQFGSIMASLTGDPNAIDAPRPPLKELRCAFNPLDTPPTPDTLLPIIQHLNLSLIDFTFGGNWAVPDELEPVVAAYLQQGVVVPASSRPDPFTAASKFEGARDPFTAPEIARTGLDRLEQNYTALKRALDFATRRVDRMHADGDLGEMEVAIEALGEMWGLKLLEDD